MNCESILWSKTATVILRRQQNTRVTFHNSKFKNLAYFYSAWTNETLSVGVSAKARFRKTERYERGGMRAIEKERINKAHFKCVIWHLLNIGFSAILMMPFCSMRKNVVYPIRSHHLARHTMHTSTGKMTNKNRWQCMQYSCLARVIESHVLPIKTTTGKHINK